MILTDNINYLRKKYPDIREQLKTLEEKDHRDFQIEDTKKGDKTLACIKDGKKQYLHSKYDPIREVEALSKDYKDIKGSNIIFYGTGLGYHIETIIKDNPNNDFYIVEPQAEILEAFLSIRNLSKTEYKNVKGISLGMERILNDMNEFLDIQRGSTVIVELPSHKKLLEEDYKKFSEIITNLARGKRSSIITEYAFQKRWIVNSMMNLKEVLNSPNILIEKKGAFKDKPAILVAAGPSLNEEIENIRHIKDNGLAYIFSVGSAINTLIHHGIHPHVATTYDPTEHNQVVFEKIKEQEITEVPLIFGTSVGYETLIGYPGKKYHMITSQDTVAPYYLGASDENMMDIVSDAPSIAVVTMQLLENLGFSPIVLAGQNLAYLGRVEHSEGIHYSKELTEEEEQGVSMVEDVYGNMIGTNDGYNSMRNQMESYIAIMKKGRVINTTKGGAKIAGAEFRELKDIINNDLKEKVFNENWLEGNKTNYDKEVIRDRIKAMEAFVNKLQRYIQEYKDILGNMFKLLKDRNINQLELMYDKLNAVIDNLESNQFFVSFIVPMNQVNYKFLADAVKRYKTETNIYKKHNELLMEYERFINRCASTVEDIKADYDQMTEDIIAWIGDSCTTERNRP